MVNLKPFLVVIPASPAGKDDNSNLYLSSLFVVILSEAGVMQGWGVCREGSQSLIWQTVHTLRSLVFCSIAFATQHALGMTTETGVAGDPYIACT